MDKEENVADVFWVPLLVCMGAFVLLFLYLVLTGTHTEIRARRTRALLARERMS
jgi:heme exporter protein C